MMISEAKVDAMIAGLKQENNALRKRAAKAEAELGKEQRAMTKQEAWVAFASAALQSNTSRSLTFEEKHTLALEGVSALQKYVTNGCAEWADAMVEHMMRRWPEMPSTTDSGSEDK